MLDIGSDIIEIDRVAKAIRRTGNRFLEKIYSEKEQAYCRSYKDPYPRFAGTFAAKEAVSKALGTGFRPGILSWLDVEISHDPYGKPIATLSPEAQQVFGAPRILLTISHCKAYASATAIILQS